VDPTTGDILASFAHPEGGAFAGAGLATDGDGNLWMLSQNTNTVYLVDSATPIGGASWLAEEPSSGTLAPGEVAEIKVTLDSREVNGAGLYQATIVINHNDPLRPPIHVPVVMEITGGLSPYFLPLGMRSFRGDGAGIVNGDLEDGPTAWVEYSKNGWDLIVDNLPGIVTPHSGAWAVWLGGDYDELSYVEQQVTVPPSSPYLAYWHWISSEDTCGHDFAGVIIDGSAVVDVYDLCQSANSGWWVKHFVNLSAYAGQSVFLQIRAETDSSHYSNLFVDDVAFQATPSSTQEHTRFFDLASAMPKSAGTVPQDVGGTDTDVEYLFPRVTRP